MPHDVAVELGHGDEEWVGLTDADTETDAVLRAVLDGDDDTDGELDTDGQFEWLAVTVMEPLLEGEPDRVGLGECEAVTETEPENEPLCVEVALAEKQPDGDAVSVVVPLTVLVGGALLGDAVPLCKTVADTVER